MYKALTVAAFIAVVTPAAAQSISEQRVLTRHGVTFTYTVHEHEKHTRIVGVDSLGHAFDLRRRGSRVSGVYGTSTVAFDAPRGAKAITVASK